MAASELAFGEEYPATRTTQPKPTTRQLQFSEIAHHKDGDAAHGFTVPIKSDKPDAHDFNPDA